MAMHSKISLIAGAALLSASALAQPVAPLQTVEQADANLARVTQEREAAEREFSEQEAICYEKFFVNNCLDKAKEKRRTRLSELRSMEVDANHFKRKHAVEERDRELEVRARKDAETAAAHAANPPVPKTVAPERTRPAPKQTPAERQAQHEARVREREAQDAAEAGARAKKVEQYQQKQVDSKARQEEIAQKKAERAAKRAKRAADAAAKAAADAEKAKQKAAAK